MHELLKKATDNTVQLPEIELYFQSRTARFCKKDDNSLWLITLADLLAILLVFSLFLLASSRSNSFSNSAHTNTTEHSIVPLAEAQGNKNATYIYLPHDIDNKQFSISLKSHENEKNIQTEVFHFNNDNKKLPQDFKTSLEEIAGLAQLNPSTKIVVSTAMYSETSISTHWASEIINFLSKECRIDTKRIYLQSLPVDINDPPKHHPFQEHRKTITLEVKLIKDFWVF